MLYLLRIVKIYLTIVAVRPELPGSTIRKRLNEKISDISRKWSTDRVNEYYSARIRRGW